MEGIYTIEFVLLRNIIYSNLLKYLMLVIQDPINVTYQRRYCGYTEGVVPRSLKDVTLNDAKGIKPGCADHVMEISCVLSLSTQTNTTLAMIIINASIWII